MITGDLAAEVVQVARDVSIRLSSPEQVAVAATIARGQTSFPNSTHWIPYSISQGYAGLAVLWGYLDACFPLEGWDIIGREHLNLAVRGAEAVSGLPPGIFSGLSGLAFGALQLSRNGTRYQRLLDTLDQTIVPRTVAMSESFRGQHNGLGFGDFDAISGLAGVGAYLLCRRDRPVVATALSGAIESLIELAKDEEALPRWYTPPELLWDDSVRAIYPHGNLNCGLAHGIPGPLALLSLELQYGASTPGLRQSIARIADWLSQNRCDDLWGINWPNAVSIVNTATSANSSVQAGNAESSPDGSSRCAWCYGSPGVARSLWLAGEALDRNDYRDLAISAMEDVFRRPIATRRIDSPTFCHGVAGLLAITLRFANDTGAAVFIDASRNLVKQLLDSYKPRSLLGFRNIEFADREIDQPGLLDGTPGIALVLLAAATDVEPTWDRLFLLS